MFKKSIIVCAHPDDEVLWFSSILDKVDEVVISYLAIPSKPKWTIRRKKCLSEYPLKNISCLAIDESEFNSADWNKPVTTRYGIDISKRRIFRSKSHLKKYIENYHKLKSELESRLAGFDNVYTHNPWGEYGHAEHIQVYRVVKELQETMKYNLWFSNYCGPTSYNLMSMHLSTFDSEYVTLKTDKALLTEIKNMYIKNECWSWYDDWVGFKEESFKKDEIPEAEGDNGAHIFPLNFIKIVNSSREESGSLYKLRPPVK